MGGKVYKSTGVQSLFLELDGGTGFHNDLFGRSNPNAHPITAITGLRDELDNHDARIDSNSLLLVNHENRLQILEGEVSALGPSYLVQTANEEFYTMGQFARGHTIIGVRHNLGPSYVYLPSNLPIERIVVVKDEAGLGQVTVRVYPA